MKPATRPCYNPRSAMNPGNAKNPLRLHPRLDESEPIRRCGWPACQAACCVYGTWVDLDEAQDILDHAELIQPHLPRTRRDPSQWFDGETESDPHTQTGMVTHTRVVRAPTHYGGSACVFLRADYKCALQVAGEAAGQHAWRFKPFYCVLHPLELDDHGRITLDEIRFMVDEPASCLHAGTQGVGLRELFQEEIAYLTNQESRQGPGTE